MSAISTSPAFNLDPDIKDDFEDRILANIEKAEDAISWMSNLCGPHDLKVYDTQKIRFRHEGKKLNSTTTAIGQIEYGTDVTVKIEDIVNSYSISLPINGFQELDVTGTKIISSSSSGIIISPSAKCELNISGSCRKSLVRISRRNMELALESSLGRTLDAPLIFSPEMNADSGPSGAWWRTVKFIENEVLQPDSLYNQAVFIREIERSLIKGLLTSQPHNYSDELKDAFKRKLPKYILKTIEFIKSNAKQDINIEDIEYISGVSRNRIYTDFKLYFGEPPTAYLKRFRLEGVREEILNSFGQYKISNIAMEWGFNHLGRFSSDYKKLFSESPSETMSRARGHAVKSTI